MKDNSSRIIVGESYRIVDNVYGDRWKDNFEREAKVLSAGTLVKVNEIRPMRDGEEEGSYAMNCGVTNMDNRGRSHALDSRMLQIGSSLDGVEL